MKLRYFVLIIATFLVTSVSMPQLANSVSMQGELICFTATPVATATLYFPTETPTITPTPVFVQPTVTPSAVYKKGVVGSGVNNRLTFNPSVVGADWWYDYISTYGPTNGWIPMVSGLTYNPQMVIATAKRVKGYWLILNEPDFNSAMTPAQAAKLYYDVRTSALVYDPSAKFIVGGVWSLEESSRTYLLNMASEYKRLYGVKMPADGYHAHLYLCGRDYSAYTYRKKIEVFRGWLNTSGLGGEFWLTETGCLNNDATAQLIMTENKDWLKSTPFVTRYAWFAMQNTKGSGTLQTINGLTILGNLYK